MDKSRSKRPPDVNEALSSMLWTPYDQTANTSSDSLTEDERQRGERKLNRYSNPLPNSLNWWNSPGVSSRYSFPYSGSYVPSPLSASGNTSAASTAKRTAVSTTIDACNHGRAINTSTFSTTMVHSFTDDFYQYQNQMPQNLSNCQSTHKNHKSQPSLLYDSFLNPSPTERINTHLAPPSSIATATTTHDDKLFNHQRNNVRNTYTWQSEKAGNVGDLNPYVHEDSSKKQARTCTNTTTSQHGEEKLRKVTQPPNACRSYSTLSRCNERRGNKHNENIAVQTPTHRDTKTLLRMVGGGMVAAKQISHNRDSKENAAERSSLDFYRLNRHDVGENYRLPPNRCSNVNRMEHLSERRVIYGDGGSIHCITSPSTFAEAETHRLGEIPMPFPSSSVSNVQPQTHISVTLTNNYPNSSASAEYLRASRSYLSLNGPCASGASNGRGDLDCSKLREDVTIIDVESMDYSEHNNSNDVVDECRRISRDDIENDQNRANAIEEIQREVRVECASSDVKCSQSTDNCSTKATKCGPLLNADNLIITSAIENLPMVASAAAVSDSTPGKAKFSNDIVTLREKRRRDRRDRRLARTRTTNGASLSSSANEILPDIINNHLPPPYDDVTPQQQQIVPSVVSTVPVEDNRYAFSLPLVRRSASDRSGKDCCGQWFNGPPLRFLVVLVALGGVACTLGGATLGSIALAGSPTSHLTAGLLMTGVGIVLVTISGVAWRMTTSDAHQCTGRCGRRQCARGNSSFGLLYPEFQHRPPPPSYQASMQEHRLREMMLNRERQASNARASPPPTYRSNAGTLLRPPMLLQRQSRSANNVQVEIPIGNSSLPHNLMNGNSSATSDCAENQSPTSSQTITTIASINRSSDNEFTLMSASREAVSDATSLIKQNGRPIGCGDGNGGEGNEARNHESSVVHKIFHDNLKCNSSRSSSRCPTETHSDRNINCNVRVTDHNAAVNHCKNVNISNTKELNKLIPFPHLAPSSRGSMARDGPSFVGARCEMGVRWKQLKRSSNGFRGTTLKTPQESSTFSKNVGGDIDFN